MTSWKGSGRIFAPPFVSMCVQFFPEVSRVSSNSTNSSILTSLRGCNAATATIGACENCGEWEIALAIFSSMILLGPEPDVFTCSATISACETAGMWQLAVNLLHRMFQYHLEPNGICFSAAISACRVPGEWQHACDLLQQIFIRALSSDDICCTAAIGTCGQSSRWQHALQLLPPSMTEFTFGAAIGACAKGCLKGPKNRGHLRTPVRDTPYGHM